MGLQVRGAEVCRPPAALQAPSLGSSTSLHDCGLQVDTDWWDEFPALGASGACQPVSATERILVQDLMTDSMDWASVSGEGAALDFAELPLEFFPVGSFEGDSACLAACGESTEGFLAAPEPLETPPGSPCRAAAFKESHNLRTLSSAHKPAPQEAALSTLPLARTTSGGSVALSCMELGSEVSIVDAASQAAGRSLDATQPSGWRGCCKSIWCARLDKHRGVCNKAAICKAGEEAIVKLESAGDGQDQQDSDQQAAFAGLTCEEDLKCEGEELGFDADEGSSGGELYDILPESGCFSAGMFSFVPIDKLCSPEISDCSTASGNLESVGEDKKWGSEESDGDSAGNGSNRSSQETLLGLVCSEDRRDDYDDISGRPFDHSAANATGAFRKSAPPSKLQVAGTSAPGDSEEKGGNRRRGPGRPSKLTPAASEAKAQAAAAAHKRKRSHTSKPAASTGQACTQCNTHVTPVWRAGPHGPKTLCNACGVRYMKHGKKR